MQRYVDHSIELGGRLTCSRKRIGIRHNGFPTSALEPFSFERRDPRPEDVVGIDIQYCRHPATPEASIRPTQHEWGWTQYPFSAWPRNRPDSVSARATKVQPICRPGDLVRSQLSVDGCRHCESSARRTGSSIAKAALPEPCWRQDQIGGTPHPCTFGGYSDKDHGR